jgi:hypothetical protein
VRPSGTGLLVVLTAIAGILARKNLAIAIPLIAFAGLLQFLMALREERRRAMPRQLLTAILADTLDECHARTLDTPLAACFGLWVMNGDGHLQLQAGDRALSARFEAQHHRPRDPACAIWQAYEQKTMRFQADPATTSDESVNGAVVVREWQWRCTIPVFDISDRGRVTAVMSIDGLGRDVDPHVLAEADLLYEANHTVRIVRPIVSALERHD